MLIFSRAQELNFSKSSIENVTWVRPRVRFMLQTMQSVWLPEPGGWMTGWTAPEKTAVTVFEVSNRRHIDVCLNCRSSPALSVVHVSTVLCSHTTAALTKYDWSDFLVGCVAQCRTSVSDRRTFAVLHSTCGWRVTSYVGISSAVGQPTGPTQPFVLSG